MPQRKRSYQFPINLYPNRPTQECYRQHESLVASKTCQNALDSTKRTALNPYLLPPLKEWRRLRMIPGADRGLNGLNFSFVDRYRILPSPDNVYDPWDRENRKAILRIELAEDVPREEWKLDFFEPVRPSTLLSM